LPEDERMPPPDPDRILTDLGCIGLVLAASALVLAPLILVIARRIFPGRETAVRQWGFVDAGAVLVCIAIALVLATKLFPIAEGQNPLVPGLARMACGLGVGCATAGWIARRRDPDGLRALGFPRGRQFDAAVAGLTSYLCFLPGIVGLMLAWSWILRHIDPSAGAQESVRRALELEPGQRWPAVVLGVLVLPFFEELLFRGFLQPLLVRTLRERAGLVLTALCFALLHGTAASVPIFALALLLGGLMLRTQRIAATWTVHALHNALVFATVFWFPKAVHTLQAHGLVSIF
jgi:membrane protease YdiL (CAAX protease family)